MKYSPIPVLDEIKIFSDDKSRFLVTIYSSQGVAVRKQEGSGVLAIDFNDLPAGVFYYVIQEWGNKRVMESGRLVKIE
jgi:hypothetical protein